MFVKIYHDFAVWATDRGALANGGPAVVPYRTDRDHDVARSFGCKVFRIVDFIDNLNPVESDPNQLEHLYDNQ